MNQFSKDMSYVLILFLVTLLFLGAGCQQAEKESPTPEYRDISVAELQTMMDKGDTLLLVDVREEHEYNAGHIPGSILFPLGDLKEDFEILDLQKNIVLICRSGQRSAEAAQFLIQQGFERVYNLQGGMLSWPGLVEEVQPYPR